MTVSRRSGSESASASFELLHPGVQRWIWQREWSALHDAQEAAIPHILAARDDILISAATASGKTEAAFLPICSLLAAAPDGAGNGFGAVYIGPLKALINDQFGRLEELCELLHVPVHRWHGDVDAARKARLVRQPSGILLITPESLEALFVNRGSRIPSLFQSTGHIVIDELHSFIGSERGAQLQSLLHRLELAVRRTIPRIGLSATLGDMDSAAEFLRPGSGPSVRLVDSSSDTQELRLQLRGFCHKRPETRGQGAEEEAEDVEGTGKAAVADHLFRTLRGVNNLVFANSRQNVELFTDMLARRAELAKVPNEFVPHHGNLSKEIREDTEARLKDRSLPVTALCTSTLEMGIDIGSVASVAQIGAPPGVAALRQRLGRSGRRGGPATLRLYVVEPEITPKSALHEELRVQLVQSIATVELLRDRWYEPSDSGGLHLSTLIQQILSMISEHGGVTARDAFQALCERGPFQQVTGPLFAELLRDLGAADLLRQEPGGLLLHGTEGERIANHYTFFAAFASVDEYRLIADGRTLGSLPVEQPLAEGGLLIFAGRRWRILTIDRRGKTIVLSPSGGGRAPDFTGTTADVHDRVRAQMRIVYESADVPTYLDAGAQRLLVEGRDAYRRLDLARTPLVDWGDDTLLIPLRGDTIMNTLALALNGREVDVAQEGAVLALPGTSDRHAADVLAQLAAGPPPDPLELAAPVPVKAIDKYDDMLGEQLLTRAYAAHKLDVPGTWAALPDLAARAKASTT